MRQLPGSALFVSNHAFLSEVGGGVQWCTHEYLSTLRKVWKSVEMAPFSITARASSRVRRAVMPAPFQDLHEHRLIERLLDRVAQGKPEWVLLNNMDAAVLAPRLRATGSKVRLAYLSHGAELVDVVNNMRLNKGGTRAVRSDSWIGKLVRLEIEIRRSVDAVICISDEDRVFERWLGSENVLFVPRQVVERHITLRPVRGRIGTVATLDHGPNADGIRRLARQLDKLGGVELRLVGGPSECGSALASHFRCVTYLGRLSEPELEAEAGTWCAFANPIFCQARGASTKVATALGWGLPVLTTPHGARGYRWNENALPLSHSAEALADLCASYSSDSVDLGGRAMSISRLAPTVDEAANLIGTFLSRA